VIDKKELQNFEKILGIRKSEKIRKNPKKSEKIQKNPKNPKKSILDF
jgi:hypothetical protein